jgi:ribonucleases P/MRP protein subunit RPP40
LNVTSGVSQGSVLGPLLFVIFINDLMINIFNKLELFADDTKMMSQILNENSCKDLQEDLIKLLEWSEEWSIKFNEEKCKVMHIGRSNPQFEYKMNGHILQETEIERDLGVIISKDLEWGHHVISATNKANRKPGLIKHSFNYLDVTIMKLLYKSMVRPHLEYAATVWSPSWVKDINRLEDVQRRATKIEQLKGMTYEERRKILKIYQH